MTPCFPFHNAENSHRADAVIGRDLIRPHFPTDVPFSDRSYLVGCKTRIATPLAARLPAFRDHVGMVDRACSFEQVRGIATRRVVTRVASVICARVDAVVKPIRHAIRSVFDALNPKATVAISGLIDTSHPRPAFIGGANSNGGPEPGSVLRGYFGKNTILNRHGVTSSTGDVVLGPQAVYQHPCGSFILAQVAE